MQRYLLLLTVLFSTGGLFAQNLWNFTSVAPGNAADTMIFPAATHQFQYLIEEGDLADNGPTAEIPDLFDFTGFVPVDASTTNNITLNSSSTQGYLSINSEDLNSSTSTTSGSQNAGVTVLDLTLDQDSRLWNVDAAEILDFTAVGGTARNCSGGVTPWGTVLTAEEPLTADNLPNLGWVVELDPATKTVLGKRWGIGQFSHENASVHPRSNNRVVYSGCDCGGSGFVVKFVADNPMDLTSGQLYVLSVQEGANTGEWIAIDTPTGLLNGNTTSDVADARGEHGFTGFNGVEDVEIDHTELVDDPYVYFTAKGDHAVYRFQEDGDPVTSMTVRNFEVYAGSEGAFNGGSADRVSYDIELADGTTLPLEWGDNDNLTIDNAGNLWVLMDDGGPNEIVLVEKGHTQENPKVKLFMIAPAGSEPTGMTFTPDNQYMFVSIQHPNATNVTTSQQSADGSMRDFDKDVAIVIALQESAADALPLTLLDWKGTLRNDQVELAWTTTEEVNMDYFTIQRQAATNGTWENLGKVASKGDAKSVQQYSFTDKNPQIGVNYYRMLRTDQTGKTIASNLILIRYQPNAQEVLLYPSPVRDVLKVTLPTATKNPLGLMVRNAVGQIVKTVMLEAGAVEMELSVSEFAPGIYYLTTGLGATQQFVIVR